MPFFMDCVESNLTVNGNVEKGMICACNGEGCNNPTMKSIYNVLYPSSKGTLITHFPMLIMITAAAVNTLISIIMA